MAIPRPSAPTAVRSGGGGGTPAQMYCVVRAIDLTAKIAHVRDQLGQERQISLNHMIGKGVGFPAVGETWMVSSAFGTWMFVAQVNPSFPPAQDLSHYVLDTALTSRLAGYVQTPTLSGYAQTTDSRLSDARTPTGTAGGVLTGTYPNPGLSAPYYESAYLSVVSIASGTVTALTGLSGGNLLGASSSSFNLSTGIWTCPQTGVYTFSYGVGISNPAVGYRWVQMITRNGTAYANEMARSEMVSIGSLTANVMAVTRYVTAGSTVQFLYYQNSGTTYHTAVNDNSFVSVAQVR